MSKLILTRGLPASGKSTYARKLVAENTTTVRLNRDDFRQMLFGKAVLDTQGETMVTVAQHGAVENALKAGFDVIVDDTNFFARGVKSLMTIAAKYDAEVEFKDFTDVPLHECILRDAGRRDSGQSNFSAEVGEKIIRGMYDRYLRGRRLPLDIPEVPQLNVVPYVANEDLPSAIIVDLDGTLAKMSDRSPYEWHRVGEDTPVPAVVYAVRAAIHFGYQVIFMSGRDASCRNITQAWLETHVLNNVEHLFMRAENDNRRDDIVKLDLFDTHVRDNYNVEYVLDDRAQVVRMWRKLGLSCFQVAPGEF
jgi:predicted kinase